MSLRVKWVMVLVGLTAVASGAVGLLSYRVAAAQLDSEVNRSLVVAVEDAAVPERRIAGERRVRPPWAGPGDVAVQRLRSDGSVVTSPRSASIPVDDGDLALASDPRRGTDAFRDDEVHGEAVRVLTVAMGQGRGALQAARSIEEMNRVLASLRTRILTVALGVAAVAAVVGVLIGGSVTRRLLRLTEVAEGVADTGALDASVATEGSDEVARLGRAFNEMLAALAASEAEQARLVQDAGHELRTPMTSLRTNIFTLRRFAEMDAATREAVIADLEAETEELSSLIEEVLEVSTGVSADEPMTSVELGALVASAAKRTGARWSRTVNLDSGDAVDVMLRERQVGRAVTNMVDNACKFSPDGSPVDVLVRRRAALGVGDEPDGVSIEVFDRGPGFDQTDLDAVFARFHRSLAARSLPGSGLGLSIVAAVAEAHGGWVKAVNRDGGGAHVTMWLPVAQGGGNP